MSIQDELLVQVRTEITSLFENHKYFEVKHKNSEKGECDHIYFIPKLHQFLAKKGVDGKYYDHILGAVQRDNDKIRLRFYERNINKYLGLASLFEKFSPQSPYFNSKDSNEAICFDYRIGYDPKKIEVIKKDVQELLVLFQKIEKAVKVKKQKERSDIKK